MDVIWGHGTPHQQFAFLLITKFRAIWIKHHSASDGVLFRRIANNKTIASKCKGWRCESYLSDLFFARFKIAIFTEGDLRCDSRCSMMKIH